MYIPKKTQPTPGLSCHPPFIHTHAARAERVRVWVTTKQPLCQNPEIHCSTTARILTATAGIVLDEQPGANGATISMVEMPKMAARLLAKEFDEGRLQCKKGAVLDISSDSLRIPHSHLLASPDEKKYIYVNGVGEGGNAQFLTCNRFFSMALGLDESQLKLIPNSPLHTYILVASGHPLLIDEIAYLNDEHDGLVKRAGLSEGYIKALYTSDTPFDCPQFPMGGAEDTRRDGEQWEGGPQPSTAHRVQAVLKVKMRESHPRLLHPFLDPMLRMLGDRVEISAAKNAPKPDTPDSAYSEFNLPYMTEQRLDELAYQMRPIAEETCVLAELCYRQSDGTLAKYCDILP